MRTAISSIGLPKPLARPCARRRRRRARQGGTRSKQLTPRTSSRRKVGWRLFLAALALSPVAAPLGAQSIRVIDEDEPRITVQNNRDEAVTIYLDTGPFEQKLGTIEPLSMATL